MNHTQTQIIQRQPTTGDAVILVMGVTGVGKSTFISQLTGEEAGIGHDLTSYTKGVGIYSMTLNKRLVYLVDTPGFNDTWRSDLEILKEIAFILSQIYRHGMKLAGILYLHRISDNRVSGSTMKNFTLLEKICGPKAAARVFLVTTMWDLATTGKLNHCEAAMREMRLASTMEFWGRLCQQGSRTRRWQGDYSTAVSIISELIALNDRDGYVVQQIQREIVDEGKALAETIAGQELLTNYKTNEGKCIAELRSLERGGSGDPDTKNSLSELRNEICGMQSAQRELRVSIQNLFAEREEAYGQVLSKLRAEQRQLAGRLEEGQHKYRRLEADMQGNEALIEEERRDWQLRRANLDREEQIGRRKRQSIDAERRRIEEEELDFDEQFNELQLDNEEERVEAAKIVENLRKREVMKRNLMPFLGVLGGVGLAVAGAVTGLAPLTGAGIGVGFGYAAKLQFSRKLKTDDKDQPSMWDTLVWGGQGAAGASVD